MYAGKTLAVTEQNDDVDIRKKYRPFVTSDEVANSDWISQSELSTALKMSEKDMLDTNGDRIKILVLYGSMRERSVLDHVCHVSLVLIKSPGHILVCWRMSVREYSPDSVPTYASTILPACRSKTTFSTNIRRYRNFEISANGATGTSGFLPSNTAILYAHSLTSTHAIISKADDSHGPPFSRTKLTGFP